MRLTHVLFFVSVILTVNSGKSGSRTTSGGSHGGHSSGHSSHVSSTVSRSPSKPHTHDPKPSRTHITGNTVSLSSGARNHNRPTLRPTTRPQIYNRNTPRPLSTHHSSSGRPNSTSSRVTTITRSTPRPIAHPKPSTPHRNSSSVSQHGRFNSSSSGGLFHHSSSGRPNSTSSRVTTITRSTPRPIVHPKPSTHRNSSSVSQHGRFNSSSSGGLGSSSSTGGGSHHGRVNSTSVGGGLNHGAKFNGTGTGRFNSSSAGGGSHNERHNITGVFHPSKVEEHHLQTHATNQHSSSGGGTNSYAPSAPPLPPGPHPHTPSAPPLPGPGGNPPPPPGWYPGATHDAAHKQHTNNLHNQYPGAPPPYPGGPYPNQPPPGYPGAPGPYPGGHYPNQPPPPYPGAPGYYPSNPYPGMQQYPNHYPHQSPYYPAPPPPPPGYTPYGVPYYKEKSGIRGSDVVAGLALWELMRSRHDHHSYGIQHVHHYHQDGGGSYQPTYHDSMRERYTTRTAPSNKPGPGAYNILEMTHYITPDDQGVISSSEGNMTCVSVYNARSISNWHRKQVDDFNKQYPNSIFPLYRQENDTTAENFTVIPGRVVHREPVSITCCGTNKGKLDLNLLTNGKHPDVNCVNHIGHIPIKKLTFVKTELKVLQPINTTGWHQIELRDPFTTTPVPLAPFPPNFPSNSSTPTPLAPFPAKSSSIEPPVSLAPFPSNLNQTSHSTTITNATESVDMTQIYASLGSNSTTESTAGVTNNPSDLIIE